MTSTSKFRAACGGVMGSSMLAWMLAIAGGTAISPMAALGQEVEPTVVATGEVIDERLEALENRPIREVRLVGLIAADETITRNQLRVEAGQPLSSQLVRGDVRRATRLGRFEQVRAELELFDDGTVGVTYTFVAAPIIKDVFAVGNREVSDQDLAAAHELVAGTPANPFVIDRARRNIISVYQKRGFYQADVQVDEKELREQGHVTFRIREGARLRITDIRFEGIASLTERELRGQVESKVWGILNTGTLDDIAVQRDVAKVEKYYKDRGFLRARVDRQIQPSPNNREAILTFVVDEGARYIVRSVRVAKDDGGAANLTGKPLTAFSAEQIASLISIRAGDPYSQQQVQGAVRTVTDAYQQLGYNDVRVRVVDLQSTQDTQADLVLLVSEGEQSKTGVVFIKGNEFTQARVIRRQIKVLPDRPLDGVALRESQRRIEDTRLFRPGSVRVTPQRQDPANPGVKDILVEVEETNTGSIGFGASVDSDGGVLGAFSVTQRNFDIFDTPDSIGEFFSGRAFRGGQQTFSINLQPGDRVQNYTVGLSDPYLFETDYSGSVSGGYRQREFRDYTEERLSLNTSVGRRFGDRWTGSVSLRAESINITDIDDDAAVDVFNDEGRNILTGIGGRLRRSALDRAIRPTRGTIVDIGGEQVGALGGDYNFSKMFVEGSAYVPLDEDILGNRTVLLLRNSMSYIPQDETDVPVYERYFQGGREFRGFKFRGLGPRSPRNDVPTELARDSVGGTWSFFAGAQIEKPLLEQFISGVVFVDSGTIQNEISLADYRVSAGFGLRIYVPALGPVPLAVDFGFPIRKLDGDQTRLFSFSLDVPFQ